MRPHQQAFVELLVAHEVIRFGEFTLKSGRKSPYFINAGQLRTGNGIAGLGAAYAEQILTAEIGCDLVFGPSYKGVPLAVATAMSLAARGHEVGFGFDRKEPKDHGEGGVFVGTAPANGDRVVVVDDVITSGRSIREAVELLARAADVDISGVVVAVDRQERGKSDRTTLVELEAELGVHVHAIVTISELVEHLSTHPAGGRRIIDDVTRARITAYLAEYGAQ